MLETSTTSVTDPNAVKSTATTVSQGVRAFAKPIRIVRSTPDSSCSSSSEVILIKRPKASEAVPNHQEASMARAENLAGLRCMPYLPHTASTSTAEKIQKTFPLLGREAWLGGTIGGRRNHWRSCFLQLFKFSLNSCPVLWFSLRRVR